MSCSSDNGYWFYRIDANFNREDNKEHCWENILDSFESNEDTCVLWNKYHAFQIMLAEKGHAVDQCLLMSINSESVNRHREVCYVLIQ